MTYAAFYLPKEQTSPIKVNHNMVARLARNLYSGIRKGNWKAFENDVNDIARNMNIQGTTAFAQRYAVGAVSKIMNGEPITNKTMMDSLFNTYAPALNLGLAQTGYNSLMQMKDAALHGTINPANFLEGFSSGLQAVTDSLQSDNLADRYGDEIPIDVVEQLDYKYSNTLPQKSAEMSTSIEYISHVDPVEIKLTAHIKNKNAELWEVNDTLQILGSMQVDKKPVTLRVGKSIYENCYIKEMLPVITNINEIKLVITLQYDYNKDQMSRRINDKSKYMILNPGNKQEIKNLLASEVYMGTIVVS